MLDVQLRRAVSKPLYTMASALDVPWITPDRLTMAGLVIGLSSAALAASQLWALAVVAWLASRVLDGLDGTLARRRLAAASAPRSATASEAGGFLDIVADFVVYGATVLGVAVGATTAFGAPWWPFLVVLFAYYINGAAFLAFSSIAERTGRSLSDDDNRSLFFLGRIAEGGETVFVHTLWLVLPFIAWQIAIVWSIVVLVSAAQRMIVGYRLLR
ncbi:CDP-alcohol phosphatidyltransferase-like enzyme [Salinibacterium amurskyense]|uniref:CDP-alcohol phosphatidyltransferase-like enzyme n=1 Tax=Salinibacterium amurskyense TaxID=205941 RepID=A0A2M9D644_9MICO|nr:CDP-alcohol phosphatidyltransferase family protein [Salinibacterium amurskyense]PJJ81187.1 CDP-alcohol phosphatidyltransferase-like enzyme [Salinibacterium amurskyense]RLQ83208.1 CDP-alcohol phosphatidyltransferase family protein [Salinibacterium amurskyense]GHD81382.1 membrane protein [Salinibacterium amurskyense]